MFAEMAAAVGRDDDAQPYLRALRGDQGGVRRRRSSPPTARCGETARPPTSWRSRTTSIPAGLEDQVADAVRRDARTARQPPVDRLPRRRRPAARADRDRPHRHRLHAAAERPTTPRGATRSARARPRSGSAGTRSCPTARFGPVEMNSFNHYAYGAVGDWMYRTMAGVSALEPGYQQGAHRAAGAARASTRATSRSTRRTEPSRSSWRTDAVGRDEARRHRAGEHDRGDPDSDVEPMGDHRGRQARRIGSGHRVLELRRRRRRVHGRLRRVRVRTGRDTRSARRRA